MIVKPPTRISDDQAQLLGAVRARFTSYCGWCGSRIIGHEHRRDGAASWILKLPADKIGTSHALRGNAPQTWAHASCYLAATGREAPRS